ncbi:hypothetical protein SAICODRAFT_16983 [Saitoella complicata NRRL Y-17804]|nr:uncharacterized protein SAICODRAFT_16983 [Saitoella complicata NRRL Y-17804]ODQ55219.1 hypothetical protein SAICODRAFT_16983 [Saitoella complicata NRRL Y-17804]
MRFSLTAVLAAAAATLAAAYTTPVTLGADNAIYTPGLNQQVEAGSPFTITWDPTTEGTVTIVLLRGPSENILPLYAIVENLANTGRYDWTPSTALEPDTTHYGLQLIVDSDGNYQYSTQFGVVNPYYRSTSSSSAASSSSSSAASSSVATTSGQRTSTTTVTVFGSAPTTFSTISTSATSALNTTATVVPTAYIAAVNTTLSLPIAAAAPAAAPYQNTTGAAVAAVAAAQAAAPWTNTTSSGAAVAAVSTFSNSTTNSTGGAVTLPAFTGAGLKTGISAVVIAAGFLAVAI